MSWLEEKYLNIISPRLERFKKIKKSTFNCRCPVCGDSQKHKTKARGYFYERKGKLFYDCKNCGYGTSFPKFLEEYDTELYKEFKLEVFKESRPDIKPENKTLKFVHKVPVFKKDVLSGFTKVSNLPEDHLIKNYVRKRGIPEATYSRLFAADNMGEVAQKLQGYEGKKFDNVPRLLLPFYDKDGNITHIQGRAVGESSQRYITLEVISGVPKLFGQDQINTNTVVKVVEGPIDSLFLDNAVAMAGSDIDSSLFDPENTVFIFDNEPRNKEIIKRMEKVIDKGFNICIWGEDIHHKDINDMVANGHTPESLESYIKSHTYNKLKAKMALSSYRKV